MFILIALICSYVDRKYQEMRRRLVMALGLREVRNNALISVKHRYECRNTSYCGIYCRFSRYASLCR